MTKRKERVVSIFVTLADAAVQGRLERDPFKYIVKRFLEQKKVIIYSKEALRYYPGMWTMIDGEKVMAVKVVCHIGPHAGFA